MILHLSFDKVTMFATIDEQLMQNPLFFKRSVRLISCPENWPNHDVLKNLAGATPDKGITLGLDVGNSGENRHGKDITDDASRTPENDNIGSHSNENGDGNSDEARPEASSLEDPTATHYNLHLRRASKRTIEPRSNIHYSTVASKRKRLPIPKTEHILKDIRIIDLAREWDLPHHTLDLKGMDAEVSGSNLLNLSNFHVCSPPPLLGSSPCMPHRAL